MICDIKFVATSSKIIMFDYHNYVVLIMHDILIFFSIDLILVDPCTYYIYA